MRRPRADDAGGVPEAAYAAALAAVPSIGPAALRRLLEDSSPRHAWEAVLDGRADGGNGRSTRWASDARRVRVEEVWAAHMSSGIAVLVAGQRGYPAVLADDPEAPAVLFCLGEPAVVDRHPRVAIVGTRSPTRYGLAMAAELGAALSAAGVVVVSGLALGIDGAAHEGALAGWGAPGTAGTDPPPAAVGAGTAPPVAVVAGSLTSPYPRQHARLWRRVAEAGAVVSEAPIGSTDIGWRFPQRNRIIAALAQVVVVVECHASGGALHTVRAANRRGIAVGAVPGSVRSPASVGTNALLADGCFVVRDVDDVMVAVGLAGASSLPVRRRRRRDPVGQDDTVGSAATAVATSVGERPARARTGPIPAAREPKDADSAAVFDAIGWERCSLDQVMRRSGLALDRAAAALEVLRSRGVVRGSAGWWERV